MQDLNSVALVGRLVRDMEMSYTKNGAAIGKMSLAVKKNVKRGDQWEDESYFFDVTLFGKSAENLKQYLVKGKQVAITGSLKQDRWEKDGQKFTKVGIIADSVQLVGGGKEGQSGGQAPRSQQKENPFKGTDMEEHTEEFQEDSDIPF